MQDVNSLFAFSRLGILFYRAENWSVLINLLYELRAGIPGIGIYRGLDNRLRKCAFATTWQLEGRVPFFIKYC